MATDSGNESQDVREEAGHGAGETGNIPAVPRDSNGPLNGGDSVAPGDEEFTLPDPVDGEPAVIDEFAELDSRPALPFPVAAIGASAGGLEAYIELFSGLARDTGIAFVVLPHLSPDHKSHMAEIIARHTAMPVKEIVHGTKPSPNRVYVLPAGQRALLQSGIFILEDRRNAGPEGVIDSFFRSLGVDQKIRAIGVVLSGVDGDGAAGLKAIKGEGGIAIVQSPDTARFSDMPRTSISADHVDRILPPAQIASELGQIGRQFREPGLRLLEDGAAQPSDEQHLGRIFNLLRGVSGVDFRLYKPSTIRRRIARRMLLHRISTLAEYATFLQAHLRELRELQDDALINVTRFFRDPQVFVALRENILPRIFRDREPDQQVRIWVAGCSSGEEVYSIAMCLLEYLAAQPFEPPIQIFGTDASDRNIFRARNGVYPESIASEVSPERLRRFFVKTERGFQVSKRLRDLCIFARQNLCHDPPFSRMDLISCRNVLIYLGPDLQRQTLPAFHYALRPNGYLLLGMSETIREFSDYFQLVDRRNKFFARIGNSPARGALGAAPRVFQANHQLLSDPLAAVAAPTLPETWSDVELQRAADRLVLARYGPPGVVIDEHLAILQSRGHTSPYLELPQGAVTLQLARMLRESIARPTMEAVQHAIDRDLPVRVEGLQVPDDDAPHRITLEVLPIATTVPRSRCFLVLFTHEPDIVPSAAFGAVSGAASDGVVNGVFDGGKNSASLHERAAGSAQESEHANERVRQDLASARLYLQTLLEERDARNQELVSANEEIQSANEEMQSTNEELETTKEELQSSNEELQTANDELQQRNATLTQTSNDLSNLLNSVNLPVLMLSNELHIRHFTPPTQRLMNLRAADVGRPLSDIRMNLETGDLEPVFHEVLDTLAPREIEVQDRAGHWYLLRMRPYRTTDNKIDGIVMVLVDIDQLRRIQQELRGARDFSRSVIESVPLPLAVVDLGLRIRAVNDAFRSLTGLAGEALERRSLPDLALLLWGLDEPLRSALERLRMFGNPDDNPRADSAGNPDPGAPARDFAFEHKIQGEHPRVFAFRGCLLQPDRELFLLVTVEDITIHRDVERLLGLDRERLAIEVASTARELGRTQDELRALAGSLFTSQEDERRRVARELHDDICQRLAMLEIGVQGILSKVIGDLSPDNELRAVREGIGGLTQEVRRISHGLHPSVIDDLGVAAALGSLVEDFREREHMIVTFNAQNIPGSVPRDVATGLYRIAQEALRNVAKHAGKTHVKVLLRGGPTLRLQVTDSGEGFDLRACRTGLGLISMEERARLAGGTFNIESSPDEGTRITVEIPILPPS